MTDESRIKELLNRIYQLTDCNSIFVSLKDGGTLDLFESIKYFNSDEKKFLILKTICHTRIIGGIVRFHLIVCSSHLLYYDIPEFSVSYLKSNYSFRIDFNNIEQYKDEKIYFLIKRIAEAYKENIPSGSVVRFITPCMIKAQTHSDRYGFGNEWAGRGGYIQGKKYGDAEFPFAVIGFVVE